MILLDSRFPRDKDMSLWTTVVKGSFVHGWSGNIIATRMISICSILNQIYALVGTLWRGSKGGGWEEAELPF